MLEMPCSCRGIPTIVRCEEIPQVRSLLPVSLGPISDRCTSNSRVCIENFRISVRVIMT